MSVRILDIDLFISYATIQESVRNRCREILRIIEHSVDSSMFYRWEQYSNYIKYFSELLDWFTKKSDRIEKVRPQVYTLSHEDFFNSDEENEEANNSENIHEQKALRHYETLVQDRKNQLWYDVFLQFLSRIGMKYKEYENEGIEIFRWEPPSMISQDISVLELFNNLSALEIECGKREVPLPNPRIKFLSSGQPKHDYTSYEVLKVNSRDSDFLVISLDHIDFGTLNRGKPELDKNFRLNIFKLPGNNAARNSFYIGALYQLAEALKIEREKRSNIHYIEKVSKGLVEGRDYLNKLKGATEEHKNKIKHLESENKRLNSELSFYKADDWEQLRLF